MKFPFLFLFITALSACVTSKSIHQKDAATLHSENVKNKTILVNQTFDYETFYIVVADTHTSYQLLQQKMYELNTRLNIPIDTMGRYYDKVKDLIVLPLDDDEDELYGGEYFPRRFPSATLSLEYFDVYKIGAGKKTIALVTGIYENKKSADSALQVIKRVHVNAFKLRAEVFVGCMY